MFLLIRFLLVVVFAPLMSTLFAQSDFLTISFDPEVPLAGQSVRLRLDTNYECTLPGSAVVTSTSQSIRIDLWLTDTCSTNYPGLFGYYDLGSFSQGTYNVNIYTCIENPSPIPSGCGLYAERTLQVLNSEPAPLPGLSFVNSIALIALLILLSSTVFLKKAGSD